MVSRSVFSLPHVLVTKPPSSDLRLSWSRKDLGRTEYRPSIAAINLKTQQYRLGCWRFAQQLPSVVAEENEWREPRNLRQAATELAFKKHQLYRRGQDPKTQREIEGYRKRLAELGADADTFEMPQLDPPPTMSIYRSVHHASFVELPVIP